MSVRLRLPLLTSILVASFTATIAAQETKSVAYPQRDILSPFRNPGEVHAPPDRLFLLLRRMRSHAENPNTRKEIDAEGRELVDDDAWRDDLAEVDRIGIDASALARFLRLSRNADERATSLYAMFFCKQPNYVLDLIAHIPGEPERKARELAYPRAIDWLRAHLRRRFGDLSEEQKKLATMALPQIGSPAAKAAGITRLPRDEDHLHDLRLIPFFQLLDLDDPLDQAQGLWFLKEVFKIRGDLALVWLEPALPRVRQLLNADDVRVREEAIGLLQVIGPTDLRKATIDEAPQALQAWADLAVRALFPPIRNLNNTIVQLHPSPERDAIVAAGIKALEGASLGETASGKTKDGTTYRGLQVLHVPDALKELAIPKGAVITAVNGVPVDDSAELLRAVQAQLKVAKHPRVLFLDYVLEEKPRMVEYRIL